MRLLLDSQALIWYVDQHHLLSRPAHAAITAPQNELLLSAAVIWEIGIKVGSGKLSLSASYQSWVNKAIGDLRLQMLPITVEYIPLLNRPCQTIIAIHSTGCWLPRRSWSKCRSSAAIRFSSATAQHVFGDG